MRLLLIEDDRELLALLSAALRKARFSVDGFRNGNDGLVATETVTYDAVVLDLGLPDCDGMTVLRRIRTRDRATPILILTARDAVEDRVAGLDAGADDYLVKPFDMTELIARVKALLRRPGAALGTVIEVGNLTFDTVHMEVRVNGLRVPLSRREHMLLEELVRRSDHVVAKSFLEDKLYGFGEELSSNSVEVHVHRLRKKLALAKAEGEIHTIRGVGYLFTERAS